ncbi:MAG: LLM class flavin-dependent oxidoreductase, partial [Thermoprotei archaeon]
MSKTVSFGVHLPSEMSFFIGSGRMIESLEKQGYEGVYLADGFSTFGDPLTVLASIATDSEINLGTCVYILSLRNPLLVAKQTATLQEVSGGRFVFGIGVGWRKDEFDSVGVTFENRGDRTDEALKVLSEAWSNGVVSFKGKYYTYDDVEVGAKTMEAPEVLIGGNSKSALQRAMKFGYAWIPTDFSPHDYERMLRSERSTAPQERPELAAHLALFINSSSDKAWENAKSVASLFGEEVEEFAEG